MRIERSVTVAADPGRVYEVVADLQRRPEWLAELRRVHGPDRRLEAGDRFVGESSLLFHDFVGTSEVVTAEPGRALGELVYLGARFTSEWRFEPGPGGTVVHHTVAIDFPGGPFGRLERWVLRRRLAIMQKASLAALDRTVRILGA